MINIETQSKRNNYGAFLLIRLHASKGTRVRFNKIGGFGGKTWGKETTGKTWS